MREPIQPGTSDTVLVSACGLMAIMGTFFTMRNAVTRLGMAYGLLYGCLEIVKAADKNRQLWPQANVQKSVELH
jgi:arginine exporter protein ArgO